MNVQPLSGEIEMQVYGSKAMQVQKGMCEYSSYLDEFHENDVAYLDGQLPVGEAQYGDNANYRIDAVLNQNKCIAIYFKKRAGK